MKVLALHYPKIKCKRLLSKNIAKTMVTKDMEENAINHCQISYLNKNIFLRKLF